MDNLIANYKKFINDFVEIGKSINIPDFLSNRSATASEFRKSLSEEDLQFFEKLVNESFILGIYSTLEKLNEKISEQTIKLYLSDEELPDEFLGNEIETDFMNLFEGGKMIDEQICRLHNQKLRVGKAEIIYGLVRNQEYFETQEEIFPFANTVILGGCMITNKKFKNVGYCEKCREALFEWSKQSGNTFGLPDGLV
jgi:hypothetical protein